MRRTLYVRKKQARTRLHSTRGTVRLGQKLNLVTYYMELLEKLTGSAASQEIPRILGNRMYLTVLTSARHLSLF